MNPSVALLGKRGWQLIWALGLCASLWGGHSAQAVPKPKSHKKEQNQQAQSADSDLLLRPEAKRVADALAAYVQGTILEEAADTEGALAQYQRALALDASNTELAVKVAYELVKRQKVSDAISILKDAVQAAPGSPAPRLHLALIYYKQLRKAELAIKYALEAVELEPDNFNAYLCAYEIYAGTGQTEKAEQILARAESLNSGKADFWIQLAALYTRLYGSNMDDAERSKIDSMLKQALQMAHDDPEVLSKVADFYVVSEQVQEAINIYARVLKLNVDGNDALVSAVRNKLARSYLRVGQSEKATPVLQELIRSNPANYEAYELLAGIFEKKGDFEKALLEFQQMLLMDSSQAINYLRVADMYLKLKKAAQAVETLKEARDKFPDVPQVAYSLAVALSQAKEHQEAVTMFKMAEQEAVLDQQRMLNAGFYLAFGSAAEQAGDLQKAEELLRKSIDMDPENAVDACNYLAYTWVDRGQNLDEAFQLLERALKAEPDNGAFLDSMGWCYFQKGDYQQALVYLQRAASRTEPPDPTVYEHLGDTQSKLQNLREALASWQKALELDPANTKLQGKIAESKQKLAQKN